ncbi:hypothetical protein [Deinococcus radiotolerans]|uniref:Uncharacterized protein n=1 Tax=Deinococcus radiotolerans TaxID=1309407 RepID=A0ABQ2FQI9_9DEIO|nr:hypothetical protein [Deinococcus radiotolerans]GGL17025.1 hypothetical protein GCM10010844_39890 [Deinococcus radiotolerans]
MTEQADLTWHLDMEAHFQMSRILLQELELESGVTVTCFITSGPEAGLTFHARTPHEGGRAGMVTVARDVVRQGGLAGVRPALAYLLRAAGLGLLPRATRLEPTPVIGMWSVAGARLDIKLLD